MPNLATAAPLAKTFSDPGTAIREVAVGLCHAGVVRGLIPLAEADRQATAILGNYKQRTSGVPGGTLGPSLFENAGDPLQYFRESALAGHLIATTLGSSHPGALMAAIESFEALGYGYRVRPVVYKGLPAAYNRALIFPSDSPVIVRIHEDEANVRALAPYNFEISSADIVLAHNLYLRNRTGEGPVYMYGKKFSDAEKVALDIKYASENPPPQIAATGYPYPEAEFIGAPVSDWG